MVLKHIASNLCIKM